MAACRRLSCHREHRAERIVGSLEDPPAMLRNGRPHQVIVRCNARDIAAGADSQRRVLPSISVNRKVGVVTGPHWIPHYASRCAHPSVRIRERCRSGVRGSHTCRSLEERRISTLLSHLPRPRRASPVLAAGRMQSGKARPLSFLHAFLLMARRHPGPASGAAGGSPGSRSAGGGVGPAERAYAGPRWPHRADTGTPATLWHVNQASALALAGPVRQTTPTWLAQPASPSLRT